MNWKLRRNYKKSRKSRTLYAIVCYADWYVREYKFAGKFVWDEFRKDYEPLVYHYNDHNGEYETYLPTKLNYTTSGRILGWTFNRDIADSVVYLQKILEKVNYGKELNN